jgi:hypothetical protein
MAGGGAGGVPWKQILGLGLVLCAVAVGLDKAAVGPHALVLGLSALGGLATIFGACEAMILCVDNLGERLKWNPFVAGAMAGLASNVPEIVMLGFVVAKEPRVAFVVACLTLHVNALVFGIYSGLLPADEHGHSKMPEAIVKLGTDAIICGAGLFLTLGILMTSLRAFDAGDHKGDGFGPMDLYALGAGLLIIEVVYVRQLVKRFANAAPVEAAPAAGAPPAEAPPTWGLIFFYGVLGTVTSLVGGHAVGEFASGIVNALNERKYPEMVGAIIVSLFAGVASYLMIVAAHMKGKYELALSNISGAITQVPYVILPATMILMAALSQLGITAPFPGLAEGVALPIDLETTSVVFFGGPTLLILWNSIADDGKVNRFETTIMVVLFALIIYFLAKHG